MPERATEHKRLLQAPWIAPMDAPPLRDAAVLCADGRIHAVGPAAKLRREHPEAAVEDLGNVIVLPGLVNAHVHLELSDCTRGPVPADGFVGWLIGILQRTHLDPDTMASAVRQAVTAGVEQCLRFGVTSAGDISRQCQLTRPLLAQSPLRIVSYGEVQAMAQRRHLLAERLAIAIDPSDRAGRLLIGVSPHAPYSIEIDGYRRCLEAARQGHLPLATHLAESDEEAVFLARHAGGFRRLWDFIGRWDDAVPTFEGGPIRFARQLGLLDYPSLLAHVNYCDDGELTLLAEGRASVVYCPRTHAYFGHPPHRWRKMLASGINVAVGTDSCASSPDLNLVDDLRLLHRLAPEAPAQMIWEMATIRAARAIGCESQVGSLTPGKAADLTVFGAAGPDPLVRILEELLLPQQVWIAGERVR